MHTFKAALKIIGVNPFVSVPASILRQIFEKAGKDRGHIRIKGTVNGKPYQQTLVKYSGEWRLYINTTMLKNSPKRIGEKIEVAVEFDPEGRKVKVPVRFIKALEANQKAKAVFDGLPPSRSLEIVRYLANLKSEEALHRNIERAVNFLEGKGRFVGRDNP